MSRVQSARRSVKPVPVQQRDGSKHRIEAKLQFITPMFGGGVKLNSESPHHKEFDWNTPVRGASLRGQLRTWWRRTCGPTLAPAVLKAREAVLWGWASTQEAPAKGLVSLSVSSQLSESSIAVFESTRPDRPRQERAIKRMEAIAYGAFPLKPSRDSQNNIAGTLHELRGSFTVQIELLCLKHAARYSERAAAAWPELDSPIEATLWAEVERAWVAFITFGGLGGRTRRGFGAVRQISPEPPTLEEALERLGWDGRAAYPPVPKSGAEQAHQEALAQLQSFRPGEDVARTARGNAPTPGRSWWPEPDELRRITHRAAPKHQPVHKVRKFPRAAFGMPIVFHFKDKQQGDPQDCTLQPNGAERLASPLIIRPVYSKVLVPNTQPPQYSDRYYAVALKLPGDEATNGVLDRLEVRQGNVTSGAQSGALSADEQGKIGPLAEYRAKAESGLNAVLNPFLNYFRD